MNGEGVIDLDEPDGTEPYTPVEPEAPQPMSRVPETLGEPKVQAPRIAEEIVAEHTGSYGARLKARGERAALSRKCFFVPTADEDDPIRLVIEASVIRDQALLVRSAANDAKYIAESTERVFWTEATFPAGEEIDADDDRLNEIPGKWAGVAKDMELPPSWKPYRAVLAACESNPLLVGDLAGDILAWARGHRDDAASLMGQ